MSDPSALFAALEAHDLDGLALALSAGADPNTLKPVPPHWSPLHEAIEQLEDGGSIEAIILLLRHGAAIEGSEGDTPLLMALYRDQPDAARLLLGAGANPNARGMEGDSPLRVVVERGDHATAATLLRCGAGRTVDDAGAPTGASALGIAAKRLDVPMIRLLLQAGADPAARDADGMTACDRLPAPSPEDQGAHSEVERLLSAGR
jgi:ankyrin repeat protein